MANSLRWFILLVLFFSTLPSLQAQFAPIVPDKPVCINASVEISHSAQGSANDGLVIQLSNGGDYVSVPTVFVSSVSRAFNTSFLTTYRATIPATIAAGQYTVRFISGSVIGTPSTGKLTVRAKPSPPLGDSPQYDCQYRSGSANANTYTPYSTIYLKGLIPNSVITFYSSAGDKIDFTPGGIINPNSAIRDFKSPAYVNASPKTVDYYVTQSVDGCESDKQLIQLIVKPQIDRGPTVTATESITVGTSNGISGVPRVKLCQGTSAIFGDLPIKAEPGYRIGYCEVTNSRNIGGYFGPVCDNTTPITGSTVFETTTAGRRIFRLSHQPIDPNANCNNNLLSDSYIAVDVNPVPAKPTVSANVISLCQFQQANPFAALPTNGATLVWYGTNATGGTGSSTPSTPSTANAGTFKYYVAQKQNDCESERAEITVEVKAAAPAPTVSSVNYCQGAPASQLSAVAASGGSLLWYTAATGGSGSPGGPVPSTSNVGTETFYVAQTVGASCESQRVALRVTTNALPAAPTLFKTTYTFCQTAPGEPLSASGQNLKWYETATGGTGLGTITPSTASAGTKSYYVSQTVNGCESPRSSVNVDILAAPAAPTVSQSTYEFCQGTANALISGTISPANQTGWYIYGDEPGLLNFYTNGTTAYAVVPTAQARSLTYSLFQTAPNGCKGPASQQINIVVKPTPAPPTVQAITVCQNAPAPTLQPGGQNLLWYTASSGGTGSATTPVINTAQTSQTTYYVSQTGGGCESPRAAFSVTVNAIPNAPTVDSSGPAYCQNATATALTATGQGLKWYREALGGMSIGDKPVPDTREAGTFTYYVSQTVNGCEGGRSSVTVRISAAPAAPAAVNSFSYCQKTTAAALTASGNGLKWYDSSNNLIGTPTPSTDLPGTTTYYVTQSANTCESARAEIKVTVKPTPGSPNTRSELLCQNDTSRTLFASGQNLLWYTAEAGGTGSATPPTITAAQPLQINYYVSQSVDGCEGPRSLLSVRIKPAPSAPSVSQMNICQFAKAEPLTAQGSDLRWYYPDGKPVGATPTPPTDRGAAYPYQVSQVVDGCEGPRSTLTVTILTTPAPTVTRSTVEVCLGSTPQPLQATGENLKWTDPAGNVTTTTPTPPTLNATIKPEGDIFYVTQTGSNGCESPRTAISVFVQTPPTMSIIGSTTTNLGLEVPLKLTFTGVGPYRYKLSDGSAGTVLKDTVIMVLPTRTLTYQVVEVANKCGVGLPGSAATAVVTVRVPTIETLAFSSSTLCAGNSLATNFTTSGAFNTGSVFKLQYAKVEVDSTKLLFVDALNSQASNGTVAGLLPDNMPAGTYWVRVMATNPKIPILGSISPTRLTIRSKATGTLTGTQSVYEGQPAKLSVAFTGDGPWHFYLRDSTANGLGRIETVDSIYTTSNPYTFEVRPARTTAYFITDVYNGCGTGVVGGSRIIVTVAPLLGIEDQSLADAVDVFPVPTTTTLTVRINGLTTREPAFLELTDATGRTVLRQETRQQTSILKLDHNAAGTYILRIHVGNRSASKRILKL
jgi:hypothetical protein